jgi:hypothetical protein
MKSHAPRSALFSWLHFRRPAATELGAASTRRATLQLRRSILRKLTKRMTSGACPGS